MPDITDIDSTRLRELATILFNEDALVAERTPAGALTTIGASVRGSLIAECHGAVALDILEMTSGLPGRFDAQIDALRVAADILDEQEQANAAAVTAAGAEPPR